MYTPYQQGGITQIVIHIDTLDVQKL